MPRACNPGTTTWSASRPLSADIRQILVRNERPDAANIVNLEFLLSDAYLVYAAHLLNGRVNPETLHADEWTIYPARFNLARHLSKALEGGDVEGSLKGLLPAQQGYGRLKTALSCTGHLPSGAAGPSFRETAGSRRA